MSFLDIGGTAPKFPDPNKLAQAQYDLNRRTAEQNLSMNRVNQTGPFGTMTYGGTGSASDPYTQNVEMNPGDAANYKTRQDLTSGMFGLSMDQLAKIRSSLSGPTPQAGVQGLERVEDALYSRLEPQLDRDRNRLRTQLLNSGHAEGSAGYMEGMDEFSRAQNDARMRVLLAGGAEQNRQFGLDTAARLAPINEMQALQGATPGIQAPSFQGVPTVGMAGTDLVGPTLAAHQSEMNTFNQDQYNQRAQMGELYGLGGTLLGAGLGPDGFLRPIADKVGDTVGGWFGLGGSGDGLNPGTGSTGAPGAGGGVGSLATSAAGNIASSVAGDAFGIPGLTELLSSSGGASAAMPGFAGMDTSVFFGADPLFDVFGAMDAVPGIAGEAGGFGTLGSLSSVIAPLAIGGLAYGAFSSKSKARDKYQAMWDATGDAIRKAPKDANGNSIMKFGDQTLLMKPDAEQPFGEGSFYTADGRILSIGQRPDDFEIFDNYEAARRKMQPNKADVQQNSLEVQNKKLASKFASDELAKAIGKAQARGKNSGPSTRKQQHLDSFLFDESGGD